jgi:hypothetical protein
MTKTAGNTIAASDVLSESPELSQCTSTAQGLGEYIQVARETNLGKCRIQTRTSKPQVEIKEQVAKETESAESPFCSTLAQLRQPLLPVARFQQRRVQRR